MSRFVLEMETAEIQLAIREHLERKGYKLADRASSGVTFKSDKMLSPGTITATIRDIEINENSGDSEASRMLKKLIAPKIDS